MTIENEARFTLSGEIGGLTIDITLQHKDAARLRSGVVRFTRQVTNEMVAYALEEKRLDADKARKPIVSRQLRQRLQEPVIDEDLDEYLDEEDEP